MSLEYEVLEKEQLDSQRISLGKMLQTGIPLDAQLFAKWEQVWQDDISRRIVLGLKKRFGVFAYHKIDLDRIKKDVRYKNEFLDDKKLPLTIKAPPIIAVATRDLSNENVISILNSIDDACEGIELKRRPLVLLPYNSFSKLFDRLRRPYRQVNLNILRDQGLCKPYTNECVFKRIPINATHAPEQLYEQINLLYAIMLYFSGRGNFELHYVTKKLGVKYGPNLASGFDHTIWILSPEDCFFGIDDKLEHKPYLARYLKDGVRYTVKLPKERKRSTSLPSDFVLLNER